MWSCGGMRNQASMTTVESGGKSATSDQIACMLARPSVRPNSRSPSAVPISS